MVAALQAGGPEQVGEAVAVGLVLGEGQLLARRRHDQRRLVWMGLGMIPRVHARRP